MTDLDTDARRQAAVKADLLTEHLLAERDDRALATYREIVELLGEAES